MKYIYSFVLTFTFSAFSIAQSTDPVTLSVAKPTHTMIDSAMMKTQNQRECELIAAMSLDRKELRIIRADPPKGKYNMTYFVNHPELISKYGSSYLITDLVDTKSLKVLTIQASFNFDDNQRDVLLVIHLADGAKLDKKISVDAEFFRDHAKACIK